MKRSWSKVDQVAQTISKPGLIRNMTMLSVWWGWKGIINCEFLAQGKIIDSDFYCQRLISKLMIITYSHFMWKQNKFFKHTAIISLLQENVQVRNINIIQ